MTSDLVLHTVPRPGVVQLTLNRPGSLNALDAGLFDALHAALDTVAADGDCRAVVLTGAGRAFCAGGDMGLFAGLIDADPTAFWRQQRHGAELVPRLRRLPQPVIAAVNGPAVGGGLSLTCACDIRLAAADAVFACAGRRVGLSAADMGVGWLLPRLIGLARAQELMLTGRQFGAPEALEAGLLARVVDGDQLLEVALATAEGIADGPRFATQVTKEALWDSLETPSMQAMMDLENRHQALLVAGPEHREAVTAFEAGRLPDYRA
jgi:enoyl-CoA hydratase